METVTQEPSSPHAGRPPGPDEERLAQAKRRLAALKGFYIHLFVFAMVVAGLAVINLATGGPWWVLWVLLGWGIGIIAHAITVFGRTPQMIADWEQQKLRQFMGGRRGEPHQSKGAVYEERKATGDLEHPRR